jgi:peroxiredoxin
MEKMLRLFISSLIFFFSQVCNAQKKFSTVIRLPESIDVQGINIYYEDGQDVHRVTTVIKNKATISGTFYSKYVTLKMFYARTDKPSYYNEYFLMKGNSSLTFTGFRNGDTQAGPFDRCKLSNAIEIRNLPEAKKMHLVTEQEESRIDAIFLKYNSKAWGSKQDSLMQVMHPISVTLIEKQMEFVKENNDKYYSLWLFQQKFLSVFTIQHYYDTLSKIYASFPAVFRNSFEGKEIVKIMNGVMLAKKGFKAPTFAAKDISGATINLHNYRGKYVLLHFWASWCGPCLQEMPAIKKIRDSYPDDQLEMISITIDKDSVAFAKAMETNKMNWTNIFDKREDIYAIYGEKPVPSVYLINNEGVIVYSNSEEDLNVLNDLLSKIHFSPH